MATTLDAGLCGKGNLPPVHCMDREVRIFSSFCRVAKRLYPTAASKLELPDPDLKKMKEWCTRPIESLVQFDEDFTSSETFSLRASQFLLRKVLPSGPDNPVPAYLSKLGTARASNTDYMRFVQATIVKLFPTGWDRGYEEVARRCVLSKSASLERKRSEGGGRAYLIDQEELSQQSFFEACINGFSLNPDRKVSVIEDNGKKRIVTVASAFQSALLPLHVLLYSHLSKREWLLRGDAKPNSFKDFTVASGEYFVSGDYESATDNFVLEHSQMLLHAVLARSENIPEAIVHMALGSLTSNLTYQGCSVRQRSGQLMGNLLSFPLLCLTNYLAFRYAVPFSSVPDRLVRINGDDIAFRGPRPLIERWCDSVEKSGLTLSKGKTLVHKAFFSLNSTFFRAKKYRRPAMLPVIRGKAVWGPVQTVSTQGRSTTEKFASRLSVVGRGHSPVGRAALREELLRFHRKYARTLPCSLNRGLGVKVDVGILNRLDLLDQEIYHFRKPARSDKREKPDGEAVPGFKLVEGKPTKEENEVFSQACIQHAWRKGQLCQPKESRCSSYPAVKKMIGSMALAPIVAYTAWGDAEQVRFTEHKVRACDGEQVPVRLSPGAVRPMAIIRRGWGSARAFFRAKKRSNQPVVARITRWYTRGGEKARKQKWVPDCHSTSYTEPVKFVFGETAFQR